ncbi:hypothetical protein HC928_02080 [bacterium]|nr:hypothetical protein [bacterium]
MGNLLGTHDGTSYRYDALNRLVSVGAGAIQYTYNGDGVLVAETVGTTYR